MGLVSVEVGGCDINRAADPSVLADDSTEEIRRALKRLQDEVEGFERRGPGGRKPSSTRRSSRDYDEAPSSDSE